MKNWTTCINFGLGKIITGFQTVVDFQREPGKFSVAGCIVKDLRGEFNKLVFFYTIHDFFFLFLCSVNLFQLNDNSRSVNTYIFALTFCLKTYTHRQKWKVSILSSEHS